MRRIAGWILPCAVAGLLLLFLAYPSAAMEGVWDGLILWARHVLPSLLPYCILTQLLVESGAIERAGRLLAAPMRALFRIPGAAGPSVLLSWMSGSPTGARIAQQLHSQGLIDADDASRFVALATSSGPLFLVGSVGGMLGDPKAGVLALTATLAGALANGLLWRFHGKSAKTAAPPSRPLKPVLGALPGAIVDGCSSSIAVGGAIALFSALIFLMRQTGALSALAAPLAPLMGRDLALAMLTGILEMTNGVWDVAALSLGVGQRAALIAALASFGSLSVAAQAALFLKDRMPMRLYLLQRCTHALLAYLIGIALLPAFFPGVPAVAGLLGFCFPCVLIFLAALLIVFVIFYIIRPHRPPYRPVPPGGCRNCSPRRGCERAGCAYASTYYAATPRRG